jgi:2-phosphoglycerate kinase
MSMLYLRSFRQSTPLQSTTKPAILPTMNNHNQLVILSGTPSVGKTTLAKNLARDIGENAHNMDMDFYRDAIDDYPSFFQCSPLEYLSQCHDVAPKLLAILKSRLTSETENIVIASSAHLIPGLVNTEHRDNMLIKKFLLTLKPEQLHARLHDRTFNRDKRKHMQSNFNANFKRCLEFQNYLINEVRSTKTPIINNDESAASKIISALEV